MTSGRAFYPKRVAPGVVTDLSREYEMAPAGEMSSRSRSANSRHPYSCSVTRIPLTDKLNRRPPVCECSAMTTPRWFFR